MSPMEKPNNDDEQWRRESDADLIKRGADYKLESVPLELADELIAEQKGELAPSLAEFIRLNKVIACPHEEFPKDLVDIIEYSDYVGKIFWNDREGCFYYIDSDKNIAKFSLMAPGAEIKSADGESYPKIDNSRFWPLMLKELEDLGFNTTGYDDVTNLSSTMYATIRQYQDAVIEKDKREKHEKFDF